MKGEELRRWLNMGDQHYCDDIDQHHYSSQDRKENVTKEDVDKACAAVIDTQSAVTEAKDKVNAVLDNVAEAKRKANAALEKWIKLKKEYENG